MWAGHETSLRARLYVCVCGPTNSKCSFCAVYKTVVLALHFDILESTNTHAHNAHTHALTPNHKMTVCFNVLLNLSTAKFARLPDKYTHFLFLCMFAKFCVTTNFVICKLAT